MLGSLLLITAFTLWRGPLSMHSVHNTLISGVCEEKEKQDYDYIHITINACYLLFDCRL